MRDAQPTPFDASAFEKLLSNADASVLSPLFDRALQSIQEFAYGGDLDFSAAQFPRISLRQPAYSLGFLDLRIYCSQWSSLRVTATRLAMTLSSVCLILNLRM